MPTPTLKPITNRSGTDKFTLPKDGWIHIAPKGEYPHPSGIIQVLDEESIEAMVNRFVEESKGENFPGLLLDFDHFSNDTKAPSAAAGWIENLENREDGLWAKIRWSKTGLASVEGGDYRLCSPVWNRSDCEDLGDNRFRPERLDRCALTNDPVLKGMKPVSNRSGSADDANMVTREEMAEAIAEAVKNAGNSAGAHKGWETRRGALAAYHTKQAALHRSLASINKGYAKTGDNPAGGRIDGKQTGLPRDAAKDAEFQQAHEKLALGHEKIAASYASKAKVSSAKAHINKQLDAMKRKKSGAPKTPPPLPKKSAHIKGASRPPKQRPESMLTGLAAKKKDLR